MQNKYDVAAVVGRWQIPHVGHMALVHRALELAPLVVIVIGSAFRSRDTRNPFNFEERKTMILRGLPLEAHSRITFVGVRDYYQNARWNAAVLAKVNAVCGHGSRVALVGAHKSDTSYLAEFPSWSFEGVAPTVRVDATSLRNIYFGEAQPIAAREVMAPYVAESVLDYLQCWRELPVYTERTVEHRALLAYREKWTAPISLTGDALIQVNGRVLLIQRGGPIGTGLWAMPGGFLNPGEQFYFGAIRESREETQIGFRDDAFRAALRKDVILDHPLRSPRGRIVSQAFHFDFGDMRALPEVQASDDAQAYMWASKEDLTNLLGSYFEDHDSAIDHLVGIDGF